LNALRTLGIALAPEGGVRFRSVIATLLAAGVAGSLVAQGAPQASFGATVEVRVVNVDVQVVDRGGVPVDGLEKGDFELRVDGRSVEITNFARSARPVAALPAAAGEPVPPAEPEAAAATAPRPRLVVFLDDLHLIPAHRNRVLRELGSLLEDQEKLGVDVAIVRFDRALHVLRAPGERGRPIAEVLAEEAKRTASGLLGESSRRAVFDEIEDLYGRWKCNYVDQMEAAVERYSGPLRHDVLDSFNALRDLTASLAGLPGRRALLYVADALPLTPGQDASLFVTQLCGQGNGGPHDMENLALDLHEVSAAANAARVTFYTYQAGGLPIIAEAAGFTGGLDAGNAMIARANDQDPFQTLASDTGGRALLNSNQLEPLVEQLSEDLVTSYSLGFTPSGPADGKAHAIEVRVRRDGVEVRHRDSFFDRPAGAERGDRLMALLRFGGGSENPLGLQIQVAPTKPAGKDEIELPLRILVPAGRLVFTPGDESVTNLEIAIAVSDDRGRSAPVQRRSVTVKRSALAADLSKAVLRIPFDLKLRQGPTNLALSVRDVVGDTTSYLQHSLDLR
jgi:VWFA-related protein